MFNINAVSPTTTQNALTCDRKPDHCPICHRAIDPKGLGAAGITNDYFNDNTVLEIVFQCSSHACSHVFLGQYKYVHGRDFELYGVTPIKFMPAKIQTEVSNVSPDFKMIYDQALAAESFGLDQITGVGLRKALEFLIKDFCSKETPDEEEKIRKIALGVCIDEFVTDVNIKECAKRAAWLGNDETHYTRKWTDRDIEDLKRLIALTMHWVSSDVLTKQYLEEMPEGKS